MSLRQPASDNLLDVDKDSPQLSGKDADFFHQTTARLLFAAKRAKPDLQVAIAYLCTRVKSPSQPDYCKLTRANTLDSWFGCTVLPSYCHADGLSTHKCTLHLLHRKYQDMSDPTRTSKCLRDQADYKSSWQLEI